MLTEAEARMIAENVWGSGGTHFFPTNRNGAFEYLCSAHGGFVIDAEALTASERQALAPFTSPARRNGRDVYLFEEDCGWCLVYLKTDVRTTNRTRGIAALNAAQKTFDLFFSEDARDKDQRRNAARRDHPEDVIRSALLASDQNGETVKGLTTVFTYDGRRHFVGGYQTCHDADGEPRLSKCLLFQSDPFDPSASIYDRAPETVLEAWRAVQNLAAASSVPRAAVQDIGVADAVPRPADFGVNLVSFLQAFNELGDDQRQRVQNELNDVVHSVFEGRVSAFLNQKESLRNEQWLAATGQRVSGTTMWIQAYANGSAAAVDINSRGPSHQAAWALGQGVTFACLMQTLDEPAAAAPAP